VTHYPVSDLVNATMCLRRATAAIPAGGAQVVDIQNGRGRIATAYGAAYLLDVICDGGPIPYPGYRPRATITRIYG
jgi:hypothetical protein